MQPLLNARLRIGRRRVLSALALSLLMGASFAAKPARVDAVNVPVDRLVRNLEELIAKQPKDVTLRLNLARLYAMAYALKVDEVYIVRGREADGVNFGFTQRDAVPFKATPAADAAAAKTAQAHLEKAIAAYRETLAIDANHAVANLGLSWCLSESGDTRAAIAAYRKTLALAWPSDQKPLTLMAGQRSITEEAATHLIPLLNPETDRNEIAELRARIKTINSQASRWVTPIAVPLGDGLTVSALLDEEASVPFDADGSGLRKPWTWITPQAGWLVQDIRRTGHIGSALQLFGSVSWWLFWDNGYDALRALDDNRDGAVRGAELEGLGIWRDANANGVSEPGEVQPLSHWRIVSLSYAYERHDPESGAVASSPAGVTFANGTTRPTFDVVLRPRPSS